MLNVSESLLAERLVDFPERENQASSGWPFLLAIAICRETPNLAMSETFVKNYLFQVTEKFATDQAREHAYRPALNSLFEKISGLTVVNDPKRSQHGAPDFVFLKGKATIAYAEAKDITVTLNETAKSEQLERYYGYSNLILTNCLEFRFYRNGQPYTEPINIAEIKDGKIVPKETNFAPLEDTLKGFLEQAREPIKSGSVAFQSHGWQSQAHPRQYQKILEVA